MFILPAAPASFAATAAALPELTWLHTLRLPLALLASLILLALARHLLPRPVLTLALPLQEKLVSAPSKASPALPAAESAASPSGPRFPWFLRLSLETLPPLAPSTPATKTTPTPVPALTPKSLPSAPPRPAQSLPAPHGRAPIRAGPVRRPEPALAPHPRVGVEAPLPALYACQTPASMAKMIMSRHTYRRPAPPTPRHSRAPSPSISRPSSPAPSSSSSS